MNVDKLTAAWFRRRKWKIFDFQKAVWEAYARGESGLVHCTTGAGKTYAVWFAALQQALKEDDRGGGLRVLWITPLRALAADTEAALAAPTAEFRPTWRIGRRTGDTSSHQKKKIAEHPPEGLVTTPESLSLFLSQPDFIRHLTSIHLVVVDEWHELLSSKRGVQTELALARLRTLAPQARFWGLSATLGNTGEAARALGGYAADGTPHPMRIITGGPVRQVEIKALLPPKSDHYPWGGHLGLQLLPAVAPVLRKHATSIVFTNTRSQAELWHRALVEAMPDWADRIGLHHGSLDHDVRAEAEAGLRDGRLRAVVATSSLDLGVDFAPVDAVLQVGSPKGVARLLQRAGRSGHRPGAKSRIYCVPANTLELVEIAAVRDLVAAGEIESRPSLRVPLDVLCQHVVTVAAGGFTPAMAAMGGFRPDDLLHEVRTTNAYRELTDPEWAWALDFAARGGAALSGYSQYRRLEGDQSHGYLIRDQETTRQHRMAIGTITSDAAISVQFLGGRRLGSVEESFISRMKPGERFIFAGRNLELVRIRDNRAYVRAAKASARGVPRWMGGRMPLSSQLSRGVRMRLDAAREGRLGTPEMDRLQEIFGIQAKLSRIPAQEDLLIERWHSREGWHVFFYPFEGRLVHEGMAALFAYRFARIKRLTFSLSFNDYGFEMLSASPPPLEESLEQGLLADENLIDDILGSINASELARRRFREIARIAGLTHEGMGRSRKTARQLQISASLLYDVFRRYDPENQLLRQATREVLENQLEHTRLRAGLTQMRERKLHIMELASASPFSFPLLVERFREQLSMEGLAERVRRMEVAMEKTMTEKKPARKKNN